MGAGRGPAAARMRIVCGGDGRKRSVAAATAEKRRSPRRFDAAAGLRLAARLVREVP